MQLKFRQQRMQRSGMPTRKLLQINVQTIIKQLQQTGQLPKDQFQFIIQSSISVLKFQQNILKTTSPAIIVGDIHGQFFDLIGIFRRHGLPPQTKYIFLGDYVDRGEFSIELKYPKSIYLLRGNHQCRVLTNTHNFKNQCKSKYNIKIYQLVVILFQVLPLCCIVDNKYFCVHAGISPTLNTLQQIQKINRFCQIPEKGIMCDLLWSDPTDDDKKQWAFNSMRSCSYYYSKENVLGFLKKNNLQMILRGHQVQLQGFKYMQYKKVNRKNVLTIFSAPNYCDKYNNLGAVAIIENQDIRLDTFRHIQHPYVLPNNTNIFQWSIGIISHQAVRILVELVKTRLMAERMNGQEESIEKIKERLELCSHMEAVKTAIDDRERLAKDLCKPKPFQFKPEKQEFIFQPHKCLVSILMFMSQKKSDQKDQAMPSNQNIKQMIKGEQEQIYGKKQQRKDSIIQAIQNTQKEDTFKQGSMKKSKNKQLNRSQQSQKYNQKELKNNIQVTTYNKKAYDELIKQKNNKSERFLSSQSIQEIIDPSNAKQKQFSQKAVQKTKSSIKQEGKQNAVIFGPKITQFTKISPKRR